MLTNLRKEAALKAVRAVVMENVSARHKDEVLYLPAGPGFRLEKEIKNVITVIAKTWHYWVDHIWLTQQREIEDLFASMAADSPLLAPVLRACRSVC